MKSQLAACSGRCPLANDVSPSRMRSSVPPSRYPTDQRSGTPGRSRHSPPSSLRASRRKAASARSHSPDGSDGRQMACGSGRRVTKRPKRSSFSKWPVSMSFVVPEKGVSYSCICFIYGQLREPCVIFRPLSASSRNARSRTPTGNAAHRVLYKGRPATAAARAGTRRFRGGCSRPTA